MRYLLILVFAPMLMGALSIRSGQTESTPTLEGRDIIIIIASGSPKLYPYAEMVATQLSWVEGITAIALDDDQSARNYDFQLLADQARSFEPDFLFKFSDSHKIKQAWITSASEQSYNEATKQILVQSSERKTLVTSAMSARRISVAMQDALGQQITRWSDASIPVRKYTSGIFAVVDTPSLIINAPFMDDSSKPKLTRAVITAITQFYEQNPPSGTLLAAIKDVREKPLGSFAGPKELEGMSDNLVCASAIVRSSADSGAIWVWRTDQFGHRFAEEARRRSLHCAVGDEVDIDGSKAVVAASDTEVCEKATFKGSNEEIICIGSTNRWVQEGWRRGLDCGVRQVNQKELVDANEVKVLKDRLAKLEAEKEAEARSISQDSLREKRSVLADI